MFISGRAGMRGTAYQSRLIISKVLHGRCHGMAHGPGECNAVKGAAVQAEVAARFRGDEHQRWVRHVQRGFASLTEAHLTARVSSSAQRRQWERLHQGHCTVPFELCPFRSHQAP